MNSALKDMLDAYQPKTPTDYQNAVREVVQEITLYDLGSLFAGKLHAVLCRGWESRIKGRDFYDFVWYVGRQVRPNLTHLDARMRQSGHWDGDSITLELLKNLLRERFSGIDFKKAADEVRIFLSDPRELDLWSQEFFNDLAERMCRG